MNAIPVEERSLLSAILYGVSVALNAGLLSFVALLVSAVFVKGEFAEALGLTWFFGLIVLVLMAFIGISTFGVFLARKTWWGRTAVYLGTVSVAVVTAYGGVWLFLKILF